MLESVGIALDPPLVCELDGAEVILRGSTRWWLETLAAGGWLTLICSTEPGGLVEGRLADRGDPFDWPHAARIAARLVHAVTGHPWPVAVRLAATAVAQWAEVEAAASTSGVDLLALPPRRVFALMWRLVMESQVDEAARTALRVQLADPQGLPGPVRTEGGRRVAPWTRAEAAEGFQAALAAMGGGGGRGPR